MFRTLTHKVLVIALIMLVLMAGTGSFVIWSIRLSKDATHHFVEYSLGPVLHSSEFNISLFLAMDEAKKYARTLDAEDREEAQEELAAARAALGQMDQNGGSDRFDTVTLTQQEQLLIRQQSTALNKIEQQVNGLLIAVDQGDNDSVDRIRSQLDEYEDEFAALEEASKTSSAAAVTQATATIDTLVRRGLYGAIVAFTLFIVMLGLVLFLLRRYVVRPVLALSTAATQVANGNLDQSVATTSADEIGELQQAFNRMISDLRQQRTALEARNTELEHSAQQQQRLFETVQQLSTPLLPITRGVVALPIVGHIDTQRADAIMQALVNGVAERRARVAILDVTGIAVLDTHVTKLLFQAIQAVELLGARVLVAGITAPMAQVIVEQGIDFGHLTTYRDLGSALESVWQSEALLAHR